MTYGFIYCLGNQVMPGIYKIGMTDRAPSQRCLELSTSTSAPVPFDLLCYAEVQCAAAIERCLHQQFAECRVSRSREFFETDYRAIHDSFQSFASTVAETFEGVEEATRLSLRDEFFSASCSEEKVRALLAALKFAGVRIWRDGEIIRTSKMLRLESWMTGAIVGLKKDLLVAVPSKEPVTRLMSLVARQAPKNLEVLESDR
ncbi:GIY-YIG nuclease family protein [Pseudomonas typographi]|uniref:GIY-YIG nuclease family protein n=1 Tax=Pseudomonas typographi TaxID=2715964 RepID=UPI001685C299|nr:GIY-YIG nuclease family protein [Pseudomonas typographi]MBD1590237.1 GIY-YIG nuclease family protein [Pseudomonas typographi]